jgi:hypothetical protein
MHVCILCTSVCLHINVSYTWYLLNKVSCKNIGLHTTVIIKYTSVYEILSSYWSRQLIENGRHVRGHLCPHRQDLM